MTQDFKNVIILWLRRITNVTRISNIFKRIAVKILLSILKFIIHLKRFLTAFFVNVVIKPIAWAGQLIFDGLLVPIYRLYVSIGKKVASPDQLPVVGSSAGKMIGKHLSLYVLLIAVGLLLIISNLWFNQGVLSSDELVGRTKLSLLINEGDIEDEQLIEDYPNLDVAKLDRRLSRKDVLRPKQSVAIDQGQEEQEAAPTKRSSVIVYTVEPGDTISGIAKKFSISVNTILWENNLRATSMIKPGNQLRILPGSGVSHIVTRGQTLGQIAKLYGISEKDILNANGLNNPNQLSIGASLVIPGGSKLAASDQSPQNTRQISSSAEKLKQIISSDKKPSSIIPSGTKMVWPTSGYRITQYYSWKHTGVDIANHIGTPIYAADAGTVTTVGYNRGGYGNQIIINHGNGKQTRYAHLSAFDVKVGQKVAKGQYIGAMGSTGRSTGPHLHFEVMIN